MTLTIEDYRRCYADEIRFVANLNSPALVEAFARVPREEFIGPGPWQVGSAEARALAAAGIGSAAYVPVDDPRHLYHNVVVVIDASRDINNGLFNFASVYLFVVNWVDLTQGICRLRRGWIGEVTRTPAGLFHAELRGLVQALSQEFGNIYSPLCRADLGDTKCAVDILSATYRKTGTVASATSTHAFVAVPLVYPAGLMGNTALISIRNNVTAGTAMSVSDGVNVAAMIWPFDTAGATVFSDINSQIIAAGLDVTLSSPASLVIQIVSNTGRQGNIIKTGDLTNPTALLIENFAAGYLDGGALTWITGNNAGVTVEMKTYDTDTSTVHLWLAVYYAIQAGDTFYYYPGCDKRRDTCARKYNNIVNFRGEPDMPGVDQMISYPDE